MIVKHDSNWFYSTISAAQLLDLFRQYNLVYKVEYLCFVLAAEIKFQYSSNIVDHPPRFHSVNGIVRGISDEYQFCHLINEEYRWLPSSDGLTKGTLSEQVMTWVNATLGGVADTIDWYNTEINGETGKLKYSPIQIREFCLQQMINRNAPDLQLKILRF